MAVNYYEYVIKGDDVSVCAFIDGFLLGRRIREGYFFSRRHPIHLHFLRELIKYHGDVVHLVCESRVRSAIQAAVRHGAERYDMEIKATNRITKASFRFEFKTPNREVGRAIKRALGRHPAGVRMIDYRPEEIVDPKAEGVEAYAPVHEYTFRGEGVIEGDVTGVLRTHAKLSAIEFVECEEIELHR